jgi:hypothetical protein
MAPKKKSLPGPGAAWNIPKEETSRFVDSTKPGNWIAHVSDSPPGGFGSGESGFTDWFTSEEQLKSELKSLESAWPDASPDWKGTFEQLCTSADDFCEEQRREFLDSLDDPDEDPSAPLPKKLQKEFREWLDEQTGHWQY